MSPLEAATATPQAALLGLALVAAGVVIGWVLRSARLAITDARAARRLYSDAEFEALYNELHPDRTLADVPLVSRRYTPIPEAPSTFMVDDWFDPAPEGLAGWERDRDLAARREYFPGFAPRRVVADNAHGESVPLAEAMASFDEDHSGHGCHLDPTRELPRASTHPRSTR